jgi:hypothetical protein
MVLEGVSEHAAVIDSAVTININIIAPSIKGTHIIKYITESTVTNVLTTHVLAESTVVLTTVGDVTITVNPAVSTLVLAHTSPVGTGLTVASVDPVEVEVEDEVSLSNLNVGVRDSGALGSVEGGESTAIDTSQTVVVDTLSIELLAIIALSKLTAILPDTVGVDAEVLVAVSKLTLARSNTNLPIEGVDTRKLVTGKLLAVGTTRVIVEDVGLATSHGIGIAILPTGSEVTLVVTLTGHLVLSIVDAGDPAVRLVNLEVEVKVGAREVQALTSGEVVSGKRPELEEGTPDTTVNLTVLPVVPTLTVLLVDRAASDELDLPDSVNRDGGDESSTGRDNVVGSVQRSVTSGVDVRGVGLLNGTRTVGRTTLVGTAGVEYRISEIGATVDRSGKASTRTVPGGGGPVLTDNFNSVIIDVSVVERVPVRGNEVVVEGTLNLLHVIAKSGLTTVGPEVVLVDTELVVTGTIRSSVVVTVELAKVVTNGVTSHEHLDGTVSVPRLVPGLLEVIDGSLLIEDGESVVVGTRVLLTVAESGVVATKGVATSATVGDRGVRVVGEDTATLVVRVGEVEATSGVLSLNRDGLAERIHEIVGVDVKEVLVDLGVELEVEEELGTLKVTPGPVNTTVHVINLVGDENTTAIARGVEELSRVAVVVVGAAGVAVATASTTFLTVALGRKTSNETTIGTVRVTREVLTVEASNLGVLGVTLGNLTVQRTEVSVPLATVGRVTITIGPRSHTLELASTTSLTLDVVTNTVTLRSNIIKENVVALSEGLATEVVTLSVGLGVGNPGAVEVVPETGASRVGRIVDPRDLGVDTRGVTLRSLTTVTPVVVSIDTVDGVTSSTIGFTVGVGNRTVKTLATGGNGNVGNTGGSGNAVGNDGTGKGGTADALVPTTDSTSGVLNARVTVNIDVTAVRVTIVAVTDVLATARGSTLLDQRIKGIADGGGGDGHSSTEALRNGNVARAVNKIVVPVAGDGVGRVLLLGLAGEEVSGRVGDGSPEHLRVHTSVGGEVRTGIEAEGDAELGGNEVLGIGVEEVVEGGRIDDTRAIELEVGDTVGIGITIDTNILVTLSVGGSGVLLLEPGSINRKDGSLVEESPVEPSAGRKTTTITEGNEIEGSLGARATEGSAATSETVGGVDDTGIGIHNTNELGVVTLEETVTAEVYVGLATIPWVTIHISPDVGVGALEGADTLVAIHGGISAIVELNVCVGGGEETKDIAVETSARNSDTSREIETTNEGVRDSKRVILGEVSSTNGVTKSLSAGTGRTVLVSLEEISSFLNKGCGGNIKIVVVAKQVSLVTELVVVVGSNTNRTIPVITTALSDVDGAVAASAHGDVILTLEVECSIGFGGVRIRGTEDGVEGGHVRACQSRNGVSALVGDVVTKSSLTTIDPVTIIVHTDADAEVGAGVSADGGTVKYVVDAVTRSGITRSNAHAAREEVSAGRTTDTSVTEESSLASKTHLQVALVVTGVDTPTVTSVNVAAGIGNIGGTRSIHHIVGVDVVVLPVVKEVLSLLVHTSRSSSVGVEGGGISEEGVGILSGGGEGITVANVIGDTRKVDTVETDTSTTATRLGPVSATDGVGVVGEKVVAVGVLDVTASKNSHGSGVREREAGGSSRVNDKLSLATVQRVTVTVEPGSDDLIGIVVLSLALDAALSTLDTVSEDVLGLVEDLEGVINDGPVGSTTSESGGVGEGNLGILVLVGTTLEVELRGSEVTIRIILVEIVDSTINSRSQIISGTVLVLRVLSGLETTVAVGLVELVLGVLLDMEPGTLHSGRSSPIHLLDGIVTAGGNVVVAVELDVVGVAVGLVGGRDGVGASKLDEVTEEIVLRSLIGVSGSCDEELRIRVLGSVSEGLDNKRTTSELEAELIGSEAAENLDFTTRKNVGLRSDLLRAKLVVLTINDVTTPVHGVSGVLGTSSVELISDDTLTNSGEIVLGVVSNGTIATSGVVDVVVKVGVVHVEHTEGVGVALVHGEEVILNIDGILALDVVDEPAVGVRNGSLTTITKVGVTRGVEVTRGRSLEHIVLLVVVTVLAEVGVAHEEAVGITLESSLTLTNALLARGTNGGDVVGTGESVTVGTVIETTGSVGGTEELAANVSVDSLSVEVEDTPVLAIVSDHVGETSSEDRFVNDGVDASGGVAASENTVVRLVVVASARTVHVSLATVRGVKITVLPASLADEVAGTSIVGVSVTALRSLVLRIATPDELLALNSTVDGGVEGLDVVAVSESLESPGDGNAVGAGSNIVLRIGGVTEKVGEGQRLSSSNVGGLPTSVLVDDTGLGDLVLSLCVLGDSPALDSAEHEGTVEGLRMLLLSATVEVNDGAGIDEVNLVVGTELGVNTVLLSETAVTNVSGIVVVAYSTVGGVESRVVTQDHLGNLSTTGGVELLVSGMTTEHTTLIVLLEDGATNVETLNEKRVSVIGGVTVVDTTPLSRVDDVTLNTTPVTVSKLATVGPHTVMVITDEGGAAGKVASVEDGGASSELGDRREDGHASVLLSHELTRGVLATLNETTSGGARAADDTREVVAVDATISTAGRIGSVLTLVAHGSTRSGVVTVGSPEVLAVSVVGRIGLATVTGVHVAVHVTGTASELADTTVTDVDGLTVIKDEVIVAIELPDDRVVGDSEDKLLVNNLITVSDTSVTNAAVVEVGTVVTLGLGLDLRTDFIEDVVVGAATVNVGKGTIVKTLGAVEGPADREVGGVASAADERSKTSHQRLSSRDTGDVGSDNFEVSVVENRGETGTNVHGVETMVGEGGAILSLREEEVIQVILGNASELVVGFGIIVNGNIDVGFGNGASGLAIPPGSFEPEGVDDVAAEVGDTSDVSSRGGAAVVKTKLVTRSIVGLLVGSLVEGLLVDETLSTIELVVGVHNRSPRISGNGVIHEVTTVTSVVEVDRNSVNRVHGVSGGTTCDSLCTGVAKNLAIEVLVSADIHTLSLADSPNVAEGVLTRNSVVKEGFGELFLEETDAAVVGSGTHEDSFVQTLHRNGTAVGVVNAHVATARSESFSVNIELETSTIEGVGDEGVAVVHGSLATITPGLAGEPVHVVVVHAKVLVASPTEVTLVINEADVALDGGTRDNGVTDEVSGCLDAEAGVVEHEAGTSLGVVSEVTLKIGDGLLSVLERLNTSIRERGAAEGGRNTKSSLGTGSGPVLGSARSGRGGHDTGEGRTVSKVESVIPLLKLDKARHVHS